MSIKEVYEVTKNYTVLYVEDDLKVLKNTSQMLEDFFYRVDTSVDGIDALEKIDSYYKNNNKHYDIVISDINMPRMDGIELSKQLKTINPSQQILILSAHNESTMLQKLIQTGIANYIHKPVKLEELIGVLENIVSNLVKEESFTETKELNDQFEALLNGYDSLVIASRTDTKGIITYVNKAFETISGYSKDELIGQNHNIVSHPDTPKEIFAHLWKKIKSGKVWKGKILNKSKNGKDYWVKSTIGPYYDKNDVLLGYNSIREDITATMKAKQLNKKINTLLSNATNGYLLINKDFKVEDGYSLKCLEIFNKDSIKDCNILELLFKTSSKTRDTFEKGVKNIINSINKSKQQLYISLMPKEIKIDNKYIFVTYKKISRKHIMIILDDITQTKNLENKIKKQKEKQDTIIAVVSNIENFLYIKKEFNELIGKIYVNRNTISYENCKSREAFLRKLHTFKGLFSQMYMYNTSNAIHELESKIAMSSKNQKNIEINENENIVSNFNNDTKLIKDILGKNYFNIQKKLKTNSLSLDKIKEELKDIINKPININFKLRNVVSSIELLSYKSLYDIFLSHSSIIDNLSKDLNKSVYKFKISGDKNLKIPFEYEDFFRNFIHLYKNSLDHGIKDEITREINNKKPIATISCEFFLKDNKLTVKISDDGEGLDKDKILIMAQSKNMITDQEIENITDQEIYNLIFRNNFSTSKTVNSISGRGIGMSAVKESLDELNGVIEIDNNYPNGLTYIFTIPQKIILNQNQLNDDMQDMLEISEILGNRTKLFLQNDLGISVVDTRYLEYSHENTNKSIAIDIKNENEVFTIMINLNKKILQKACQVLFLEDKMTKELKLESRKEILNTLVGLSIQDFPRHYSKSSLGIAYQFNVKNINLYNSKILDVLIQTDLGDIDIQLIKKVIQDGK
ncbi:MAG: response regulator [Campylobacterota bacterium]|nr:response regulator [Campylobacterota bacterium]